MNQFTDPDGIDDLEGGRNPNWVRLAQDRLRSTLSEQEGEE